MCKRLVLFFSVFILAAVLTGCANTAAPEATANSPEADVTSTPAEPTLTPTPDVPLAARVNGIGIWLEDYQNELLRLQEALATLQQPSTEAEQKQTVLDTLIDEALLSQAAEEAGHRVDDASLQARLTTLTSEAGGEQALTEWLQQNHYSAESFQRALRRAMAAAWQRDQISASVPESVEQVHARQILAYTEAKAQNAYQSLQGGADFATLAFQYDSATGGELGWFPRGYLFFPALEEAAFALQPKQYTQVIQSSVGYHILQVIERGEHKLSPDARLTLQRKALETWLADHRQNATIEILIP